MQGRRRHERAGLRAFRPGSPALCCAAMTEILTITANPALDLSTEAPAVVPDRKLRCTAPQLHPGGGGVNVSRAIANLGGTSRTLLAHGGHTGDMLIDLLRQEGLEPESLGVDHPTRQSVSVI